MLRIDGACNNRKAWGTGNSTCRASVPANLCCAPSILPGHPNPSGEFRQLREKSQMRSRARKVLSVHSALACCLVSLTSCGGSANQPGGGTQQASPLKIITTQPVEGRVGQTYNYQMLSSGGGPPLTWSLALGNLPPGVTLNRDTGLMAGIPTRDGNYSFTVDVTDSSFNGPETSMQSLSITVSVPALAIATPSLPDGIVGQPYDVQL